MIAALAALAGACSGNEGAWADGGADATTESSGGKDAADKADAPFASDAPAPSDAGADVVAVDAANPDLACLGDDAGCETCCFDDHVDGGDTYFGALIGCACTTGATCHSVANCYNNLCKGNAPSASCDDCLANPDAGDCYTKADTACAGDPDCVALFDCLGNVCAPPSDAGAD